ncbi:hypothetical protein COU18_03070 [Candidatus Kaiserbacteria bacterium CG10_big_fil_rev_8_21_14_0_10_51_14]|uniref:Uncharacterized protein n=1 Tax=Candidatus Kaiserbacteria bacterium CG10_big_fil_rev_8_21_14_0_10_51_14 TaxID=1974610 RepID=A0A2H0UB55_9BACT|nr:MAG: hypothetical protein COU18_03070 [Candidatus Kaiserbacteria bacterium CG10_big_fil_rev_8_21_14_0_10_51_14]
MFIMAQSTQAATSLITQQADPLSVNSDEAAWIVAFSPVTSDETSDDELDGFSSMDEDVGRPTEECLAARAELVAAKAALEQWRKPYDTALLALYAARQRADDNSGENAESLEEATQRYEEVATAAHAVVSRIGRAMREVDDLCG